LQKGNSQQVLKAKKRRGFLYNENLNTKWKHMYRCFGSSSSVNQCARFSAKKMNISPNFIKNRSWKLQEIWTQSTSEPIRYF
jgi:hypothetical protein